MSWFKAKTNHRLLQTITIVGVFAIVLWVLVLNSDNTTAATGINKQINYQGKLTNASGVSVADGTYYAKFVIYNAASGGSCLWTSVGDCATGDYGTTTVTTVNGVFSVALGGSGQNSIATSSLNFNSDSLYLGVTIRGTAASPVYDNEMTPRKQITASPYAFNADTIDGIHATSTAAVANQLLALDASGNLNLFDKGISSARATTSDFVYIGPGTGSGVNNLDRSGGDLFVTNDAEIGGELFSNIGRLLMLNATTTNIGTLTVYNGATFHSATTTDSLSVGGYLKVVGNATTSHLFASEFLTTNTGLVSNFNADYLDNQHGSYYLNWDNLTNKAATSTILSLLDSDKRISVLNATTTNIGTLTVYGGATFNSVTTTDTLSVGGYASSTGGFYTQGNSRFGGTLIVENKATTTTSLWVGSGGTANNIDLAGGDVYIQGDLEVDGVAYLPGQVLSSRTPTLAHTFSSWAPGVADSNVADASVYINPASAVGDSNLLGLAVNGSVKALIDAEGDIFANNLTLAGSQTVSQSTISTLIVENNSYLGDASNADWTHIKGSVWINTNKNSTAASGTALTITQQGTGNYLEVSDNSNYYDGTRHFTITNAGTASTTKLFVDTSATTTDYLMVGSGTVTHLDFHGGDLHVAGDAEIDGTLFAVGSVTSTSVTSTDYIWIGPWATPPPGFDFKGGDLYAGSDVMFAGRATTTVSLAIGDGPISRIDMLGGDLHVAGDAEIDGSLFLQGQLMSSTTVQFDGQVIFGRSPTLPHTFGSWSIGAADSNAADASAYINPASAVADSNLLGLAVNGSVKFLVDAEGDVFANNLTLAGSQTVSQSTISTLIVENNSYLGDASNADWTHIKGSVWINTNKNSTAASGTALTITQQGTGNYLEVSDNSNYYDGTRHFTITNAGVASSTQLVVTDNARITTLNATTTNIGTLTVYGGATFNSVTTTDTLSVGGYLKVTGNATTSHLFASEFLTTNTGLVSNFNADYLDSQHGSYYLNWDNLTSKAATSTILSLLDSDKRISVLNATTTNVGTLNIYTDFTTADTGLVTNLNADLLDSQHGSYYLNWDNLTNKAATSTILSLLDSDKRISVLNATTTNVGTLNIYTDFTTADTGMVSNLNADQLDSQHGSYYSNWDNLTNKAATSTVLTNLDSHGRISPLNATTTNIGTLTVYTGSTFNGLTTMPDLRLANGLNASSTANFNNLNVYSEIFGVGAARLPMINSTTTNIGTLKVYTGSTLNGLTTATDLRPSVLNATTTNVGTLTVYTSISGAGYTWDTLNNRPATSTVLSNLDSHGRISPLNATTTNIGTLTVYTGSTFNGLTTMPDLRLANGLNASSTVNFNNLKTYGNATTTGSFTVDTNTLVAQADTNRVGIGLINPGQALDIIGNASTSLAIYAGTNMYVGQASAADDDYLYFDAGNESLSWDDNPGEFDFSDDLVVSGKATTTLALWIGTAGTANNLDLTGGDLYVQDGLEVDGTAYINTLNLTNALVTTYGGTGLSSWTQGDIPYYDSGTILSKLAKSGTANQYLKNSGTSNNPAWATIASGDITNSTFVTSVTASGALSSSGGLTPAITHSTASGYVHIPAAGASTQLLQYSSAGTAKWISVSGGATIADNGAITIADNYVLNTSDTMSGTLGVGSTFTASAGVTFSNPGSGYGTNHVCWNSANGAITYSTTGNCGATPQLIRAQDGTVQKIMIGLNQIYGTYYQRLENYNFDSDFTFTLSNVDPETEYFDQMALEMRCHTGEEVKTQKVYPIHSSEFGKNQLNAEDKVFLKLIQGQSVNFTFTQPKMVDAAGCSQVDFALVAKGFYYKGGNDTLIAIPDDIANMVVSASAIDNSSVTVSTNPSLDTQTLVVNQAATFYGTITIIGEATFEHKVVFKQDVDVEGKLYLSADQAGSLIIPANATSTVITFSGQYQSIPKIVVSPQEKLNNKDYWISDKSTAGFRINLDPTSDKPVAFDWIALANKAGQPPVITEITASLNEVGVNIPVELNAQITDADTPEQNLTYTWQISPDIGNLSSVDTKKTTWTSSLINQDTDLVFTLTVSDGNTSVSMSKTVRALNNNSEDTPVATPEPSEPVATTTPAIVVSGCTDNTADNYNAQATQDDGSCSYPVVDTTPKPPAENLVTEATTTPITTDTIDISTTP